MIEETATEVGVRLWNELNIELIQEDKSRHNCMDRRNDAVNHKTRSIVRTKWMNCLISVANFIRFLGGLLLVEANTYGIEFDSIFCNCTTIDRNVDYQFNVLQFRGWLRSFSLLLFECKSDQRMIVDQFPAINFVINWMAQGWHPPHSMWRRYGEDIVYAFNRIQFAIVFSHMWDKLAKLSWKAS